MLRGDLSRLFIAVDFEITARSQARGLSAELDGNPLFFLLEGRGGGKKMRAKKERNGGGFLFFHRLLEEAKGRRKFVGFGTNRKILHEFIAPTIFLPSFLSLLLLASDLTMGKI